MIVVSDTSPIRGLLSIGKIELLKELFDHVVIPAAVRDELLRIQKIGISDDFYYKILSTVNECSD